MKNKRENGFTILELLVTVGLLALLASLCLLVYNKFRERSYNSIVATSVSNIRTALESKILEFNAIFSQERSFQYSLSGVHSCTLGCDDIGDLARMFVGYKHNKGTNVLVDIHTDQSYEIKGGHCKLLNSLKSHFEGVMATNLLAPRPYTYPVSSDIATCGSY